MCIHVYNMCVMMCVHKYARRVKTKKDCGWAAEVQDSGFVILF